MSLTPIYQSSTLSPATKKRLWQRSMLDYEQVKAGIRPMMEEVRNRGDASILEKYRKRNQPINVLRVTKTEFTQAEQQTSSDFKQAFEIACGNLKAVCQDQYRSLQNQSPSRLKGMTVWRRWWPLDTIGIYTPGGRANYPSSLMMSAVPALLAGCQHFVVCVPPRDDGTLPTEVLAVAKWLGIDQVYKVGGPQAVAAMAYGTQSIPKVDKIVGPGNQYVNAAKLLAFPNVAIDLPAGPSENLIIADSAANPDWVAADLITDVEHGPDSTAILLTPALSFAKQVQLQIERLVQNVSTRETIITSLKSFGAIIVVKDLKEAVVLANDYAPEHLQVMTKNSRKIASQIYNAGSVFVGPYSAKAAGDYCSGAPHVLPTGRMATWAGPLSVESFGKWVEYQKISLNGFKNLKPTIETFAKVEGLPAHSFSATIRRCTKKDKQYD